jgi:hypothetical protein
MPQFCFGIIDYSKRSFTEQGGIFGSFLGSESVSKSELSLGGPGGGRANFKFFGNILLRFFRSMFPGERISRFLWFLVTICIYLSRRISFWLVTKQGSESFLASDARDGDNLSRVL